MRPHVLSGGMVVLWATLAHADTTPATASPQDDPPAKPSAVRGLAPAKCEAALRRLGEQMNLPEPDIGGHDSDTWKISWLRGSMECDRDEFSVEFERASGEWHGWASWREKAKVTALRRVGTLLVTVSADLAGEDFATAQHFVTRARAILDRCLPP